MNLVAALQPTARFIEKVIRQELEDQGHNMTGTLRDSILVDVKQKTTFSGLSVELEGSFLKYGIFVEKGVDKSRIPYSPGSGKKTSKYIQGLVRFVTLRRIASGKRALSIAFAIARKHKAEGMPTRNSRIYSKNSKRRGFVTFALKQNEQAIIDQITADFGEVVTTEFNNLVLKGKAINI